MMKSQKEKYDICENHLFKLKKKKKDVEGWVILGQKKKFKKKLKFLTRKVVPATLSLGHTQKIIMVN